MNQTPYVSSMAIGAKMHQLDPPNSSTTMLPSATKSQTILVHLPIELLGHCCLFLNLKEISTTHSVSHLFQDAARSKAAWNENATLPSFHHTTFPSPRIQLRSTKHPLLDQLDRIRSSSHSLGHVARWLEVSGEIRELKDLVQLIEQESTKLNGLIIRPLKWSSIPPLFTFNHSSTNLSSLRVLVIGDVHEALMTALLPTIAAIHSLEILELDLCVVPDTATIIYTLPTAFATSLSLLTKLQTLILGNSAYRTRMTNQPYYSPYLISERSLALSTSSLVVLQTLVSSAPQITRIELCCFVQCSTATISADPLPLTTQLPQVRTLAVSSYLTREELQRLWTLFPGITHLIDLELATPLSFFERLPTTIVELALNQLLPDFNSPPSPNTAVLPSSPMSLCRLTIRHLKPLIYNRSTWTPFLQSFLGNVEEFHCQDDINSSRIDLELIQLMPRLRVATLIWRSSFELANSNADVLLWSRFPQVTHLRIKQREGVWKSPYEARLILQAIPHLKEVKWNDEPWLSLDRIESYYSWESIDQRLKQRLNLDRLDQIQPILQQINTSPLPPTINLNLLSLTLIFQFLTPMDLFSAHRVCRSYRVAAVSPLVLRPNIRVRMDHEKGIIVSGTQVSFTSIQPMLSAVRSMLFQNIRILTLPPPLESPLIALPRQPDFYHSHLNRFELIPYFHSLHTLSLDWDFKSNFFVGDPTMTAEDQLVIDRVFQSATLKHLKVLKLTMSTTLLELILMKCISYLREVEMIELRDREAMKLRSAIPFVQLGKLKQLKQIFIDTGMIKTLTDLTKLAELTHSIESVCLRRPIQSKLLEQLHQRPVDSLPHLSRISFVSISLSEKAPSGLTTVIALFPSLTHLNLHWTVTPLHPPTSITFPLQLCKQLVSLEISVSASHHRHTSMLAESLCQSVNSCAGAWSHLVRFRLKPPAPESLIPFLNAATHLTDLSLEGLGLAQFDFDPERTPQPWIGRLRVLHLIDSPATLKVLPLAHSLVEFHTGLPLTGGRLSSTLLALPHLQLATFGQTTMTRTQLRQYQNQRGTVQIKARSYRTTPAPAPTPAPANQSAIALTQVTDSSTTTDTSRSGDDEMAAASTNSSTTSAAAVHTTIPPIAIGAAATSSISTSATTTTTTSSSNLEVDALSEIFMELVESLQHK